MCIYWRGVDAQEWDGGNPEAGTEFVMPTELDRARARGNPADENPGASVRTL